MIRVLILFAVSALAVGAPSGENEDLLTSSIKFVKDCGDKSVFLCIKVNYLKKKKLN